MDTNDSDVSDGVLDKDATARRLQTTRLQPDGRLGCSFVWTESSELLYGVQSARFSYELKGVGRITGAKLTPAGILDELLTRQELRVDPRIRLANDSDTTTRLT